MFGCDPTSSWSFLHLIVDLTSYRPVLPHLPVGESAKNSKVLGDEGSALWKEALSCLRKVEMRSGWNRPELGTEAPIEGTTDSNQ